MCQSCADGGRRCRDPRRLKGLTTQQLSPEPVEGRPDVDWRESAAEPAPAVLWDRHPSPIAAEAVAVIAEARDIEAATTSEILAALPRGTRPDGLAFRMKSPSSLARKLESKAEAGMVDPNEPQAMQKVSDKLTDILRYTAISEKHDDLRRTVRSTVKSLQASGYTVVEADSSYVDSNPYKGIHVLLRKGDERPIEVQFHSELSQRVKDDNHLDYEIERDIRQPFADRAAARARMVANWSTVPAPQGLSKIKTIGGVPLVEKSYPNRYKTTDNEETGGDPR